MTDTHSNSRPSDLLVRGAVDPGALAARLHWFTLGDLLRENRRRFPLRRAVVCGDVRLTYPELDDRVTRLANALRAEGIGGADRVVWLGQICHSALELLFACAKIGAVFCPINWRLSADEMAFVLEDLDPAVVFWQEAEVGDSVRAGRALFGKDIPWLQLDSATEPCYESFLASGSPIDDEAIVDPMSPVMVIYTAAFDGRPGGALLHHTGLLTTALVRAMTSEVDCDTVYLNATNVYHVGNWDFGALPTLLFGGTNVFIRRWDASEACRAVADEGVTMAFMAGPMYDALVEEAAATRQDISSLRPPAFFRERVGGYGQTEIHGVQTFRSLGPCDGSHGRSTPLAQIRLLDESGDEVGAGEVGEICVRGPVVMGGYRNRPERNASAVGSGWRHTNDLGRRERDGSITFVGPKQRMLKSGAENIYPVEVEQGVASHPAVRRCAVIGIPDERWDQSIVAVVEVHEGMSVSAEEIIEHCRARMASYKKPRGVEFMETIPASPSGLVDYAELDRLFGGGGYPGNLELGR
jgi:long-chain acyl-CoA synthetase